MKPTRKVLTCFQSSGTLCQFPSETPPLCFKRGKMSEEMLAIENDIFIDLGTGLLTPWTI